MSHVYYRDFAHSTTRRRMANGSVRDVPAATFAEYVADPFLLPDGASAPASETSPDAEEEALSDAPPAESRQCLAQ